MIGVMVQKRDYGTYVKQNRRQNGIVLFTRMQPNAA